MSTADRAETDPRASVVSLPASLGRYELLMQLASGGMGTVHAARSLGARGFERVFALKLCHRHLLNTPGFTSMFLDEARLVANLRHSNVVATHDVGEDSEWGLYIVLEYIDGMPLFGLWRVAQQAKTPMAPALALRVMIDALHGLHAAHEHTDNAGNPLHIVHRDVSPQNILVGVDGVSKLMDFGIARATVRVSTTQKGQVKGKFAYLAPEQHGLLDDSDRGEVTRRTDIFAAGCVLWELLAGERLFHRDTIAGTIGAVAKADVPRLVGRAAAVTETLDGIVQKATARDPNARFETALAFADALETCGVRVASHREVALWMEKLSGATIAMRRERLREKLAQAPSITAGGRPSMPSGGEEAGGELLLPTRSLWPLVALAGAAMLSIGVVLLVLRSNPAGEHPSSEATATATAEPHPGEADAAVASAAPDDAVSAPVDAARAAARVSAAPTATARESATAAAARPRPTGAPARPSATPGRPGGPTAPYRPRFL